MPENRHEFHNLYRTEEKHRLRRQINKVSIGKRISFEFSLPIYSTSNLIEHKTDKNKSIINPICVFFSYIDYAKEICLLIPLLSSNLFSNARGYDMRWYSILHFETNNLRRHAIRREENIHNDQWCRNIMCRVAFEVGESTVYKKGMFYQINK